MYLKYKTINITSCPPEFVASYCTTLSQETRRVLHQSRALHGIGRILVVESSRLKPREVPTLMVHAQLK